MLYGGETFFRRSFRASVAWDRFWHCIHPGGRPGLAGRSEGEIGRRDELSRSRRNHGSRAGAVSRRMAGREIRLYCHVRLCGGVLHRGHTHCESRGKGSSGSGGPLRDPVELDIFQQKGRWTVDAHVPSWFGHEFHRSFSRLAVQGEGSALCGELFLLFGNRHFRRPIIRRPPS